MRLMRLNSRSILFSRLTIALLGSYKKLHTSIESARAIRRVFNKLSVRLNTSEGNLESTDEA